MATKTATANGQTLYALVATDTTYSSGGFSGVILNFSDPSVNPPLNSTTNINSLTLTLVDPAISATSGANSVSFGGTTVGLTLDRITAVKGSADDDLIGYTATALRTGTAYTVYASEGGDSYNLYGNSTLTYAGFAALVVNLKFGSVVGKASGNDTLNLSPKNLVLTSADDTVLLDTVKISNVDGGANTAAGDTLSWQYFGTNGVTVDLDNATDDVGNTFSNFENFKGSSNDDLISALGAVSGYTLLASEGGDSYALNGLGSLSYAAYAITESATVGLTINLKFGTVLNKTGGNTDTFTGNLSRLDGTDHNDTFIVSTLANRGVTTLNGGAGTDLLSFGSIVGATVNLDARTATGISGTYSGIEQFRGSSGNDSFTASSATGFTIFASAGSDTYSLNGRGTLSYAGSSDPLTINLTVGTVVGKAAAYDIITGTAPALIGSDGNDGFYAKSSGNQTLDGGLGVDVLHLSDTKASFFFTDNGDGSGILSKVGLNINFSHFETVSFADANNALTTAPQDDLFGASRSATFWRTSSGDVWIWNNHGTAVDAYTHSVGQVDPIWGVVGIGDTGGDGKADVLFHNSTNGEIYLWQMNGGTIASQGDVMSLGVPVFLDPTVWRGLGVRDFDGDGRADVLWQQTAAGPNPGQVYGWSMSGSGIISQGLVGNAPPDVALAGGGSGAYSVLGFGDVNGDGTSDMVWYNAAANKIQYWFMQGQNHTASTISISSNLSVKGVGDFNGDGIADLVTRAADGTVVIATLSKDSNGVGSGSVVALDAVATVDPTIWTIKQVNDYGGDGHADILFTSNTGNVWVWEMNGSSIIAQGAAGQIDASLGWTLYA